MMDDACSQPPPLPPKTRKSSMVTTVLGGGGTSAFNGVGHTDMKSASLVAASQKEHAGAMRTFADPPSHVVKIRINPEPPSDGCVRISVGDDSRARGNPYFFCNAFPIQSGGMAISSGQSSPSDTLDSGTCSDLDGSTPPPLPKKAGATVTVTVNGGAQHRRCGSLTSSGAEADSDDDGSNISCDSLNGGALEEDGLISADKPALDNGTDVQHIIDSVRNLQPVPASPPAKKADTNGLLPVSLLQDIRDRSARLTVVPAASTPAKKLKSWKEESFDKIEELSESSQTEDTQLEKSPMYKYQSLHTMSLSLSSNGEIHSELSSPTQEAKASLVRKHSSDSDSSAKKANIVEERTYEERKKESEEKQQLQQLINGHSLPRGSSFKYDADRFYKFHINEKENNEEDDAFSIVSEASEDSFAGLRSLDSAATIRSAKGTVRGVRNRVRAGIATFLQIQDSKSYKEKEAGKVVVYTTTLGVVRETAAACELVKKILRTLLIKYDERDAFMSRDVQQELRERLRADRVLVPQMFVEGLYVGDADTIEKLNESGELRRLLKPYKSLDVCSTCAVCGGFRLLPCTVCNGSKKSVHRNHFTAEFVALKCMHCDEAGLVRCYAC